MRQVFLALSLVLAPLLVRASDDVLLDYFLDIKKEKYFEKRNQTLVYNELKAYKSIEAEYQKLLERTKSASASDTDVRRFTFFGFAAYHRHDAASMEAFDSDFMLVFNSNTEKVLDILALQPVLIKSSCYYLGTYFGFEDKHKGEQEAFYQKYEGLMLNKLGQENTSACISMIASGARKE